MDALKEYLKGHSLAQLEKEHAIKIKYSDDGKLAILNYNQIESVKTNPVVMCCRGTVVDVATKYIVASSFHRFFNLHECMAIEKSFNWGAFTATDKEDGSLIVVYYYGNKWNINTRGSFGNFPVENGYSGTWADLFKSTLNFPVLDSLPLKAFTLCFELGSIFTQVVRRYNAPTSYLLAGFHTATQQEIGDTQLDHIAEKLGCKRPIRYEVNNLEDVAKILKRENDPTYEGVVLNDGKMRIKMKREEYLCLHRLSNNGNLASDANLIPLILKGEVDEVIQYFPSMLDRLMLLGNTIWAQKAIMNNVWGVARNIVTQKDFAAFVLKHTKLASMLFEARKKKVEPNVVWEAQAADWFVKNIDKVLKE